MVWINTHTVRTVTPVDRINIYTLDISHSTALILSKIYSYMVFVMTKKGKKTPEWKVFLKTAPIKKEETWWRTETNKTAAGLMPMQTMEDWFIFLWKCSLYNEDSHRERLPASVPGSLWLDSTSRWENPSCPHWPELGWERVILQSKACITACQWPPVGNATYFPGLTLNWLNATNLKLVPFNPSISYCGSTKGFPANIKEY